MLGIDRSASGVFAQSFMGEYGPFDDGGMSIARLANVSRQRLGRVPIRSGGKLGSGPFPTFRGSEFAVVTSFRPPRFYSDVCWILSGPLTSHVPQPRVFARRTLVQGFNFLVKYTCRSVEVMGGIDGRFASTRFSENGQFPWNS